MGVSEMSFHVLASGCGAQRAGPAAGPAGPAAALPGRAQRPGGQRSAAGPFHVADFHSVAQKHRRPRSALGVFFQGGAPP